MTVQFDRHVQLKQVIVEKQYSHDIRVHQTLVNYYLGVMRVIGIELKEEFDRNFDRKGFFGKPWKRSEHMMVESGDLRKSLSVDTDDDSVEIYSDVEYAEIHNEGGRIRVSEAMRRYFWARYAERHEEKWRNMALKKVGSHIEIPERRFVGDAPEVRKAVEEVLTEELEGWLTEEVVTERRGV